MLGNLSTSSGNIYDLQVKISLLLNIRVLLMAQRMWWTDRVSLGCVLVKYDTLLGFQQFAGWCMEQQVNADRQ